MAGDLAKLARVSGVAAGVEARSVPLSDAAQAVLAAEPGLIDTALTGGDDYEIVCTVAPGKADAFRAAAKAADVAVTDIGEISAGEGASFLGRDGKPLVFKHPSFSHF